MRPSMWLSGMALLAACGASTRSSTDAAVDVCGGAQDALALADATMDSSPGATCTPTDASGPSTTYDYVINTLTIDDNTSFNQPLIGFNIDHAWSPPMPGQLRHVRGLLRGRPGVLGGHVRAHDDGRRRG